MSEFIMEPEDKVENPVPFNHERVFNLNNPVNWIMGLPDKGRYT